MPSSRYRSRAKQQRLHPLWTSWRVCLANVCGLPKTFANVRNFLALFVPVSFLRVAVCLALCVSLFRSALITEKVFYVCDTNTCFTWPRPLWTIGPGLNAVPAGEAGRLH